MTNGLSSIKFRWQYDQNNTHQETRTQNTDGRVSIFMHNDPTQSLNQKENDNGIIAALDDDDDKATESEITIAASTNYAGANTGNVVFTLDENGNLVKANNSDAPQTYSGFLEFDQYSNATPTDGEAAAAWANGQSSNYNRVSQQTRDQFANELALLGDDYQAALDEMSDAEITALNHFGGNVFIAEDGKMYRQPTEKEYQDAIASGQTSVSWIEITDPKEIAVRKEAMERAGLQPPTATTLPEEGSQIQSVPIGGTAPEGYPTAVNSDSALFAALNAAAGENEVVSLEYDADGNIILKDAEGKDVAKLEKANVEKTLKWDNNEAFNALTPEQKARVMELAAAKTDEITDITAFVEAFAAEWEKATSDVAVTVASHIPGYDNLTDAQKAEVAEKAKNGMSEADLTNLINSYLGGAR